jgi:hypothetical protein
MFAAIILAMFWCASSLIFAQQSARYGSAARAQRLQPHLHRRFDAVMQHDVLNLLRKTGTC